MSRKEMHLKSIISMDASQRAIRFQKIIWEIPANKKFEKVQHKDRWLEYLTR